ncbi:hypothetical protein GT034_06965 [Streptomyces sp. SID2563]|uniref:hypothetical protein n=1 Tax=Streptomyces sp. SID2563 TaxID=2690255 RepID=UPI0013699638|nr:hypothetical protein [Streptomyces sp. SID2563]MYW08087.1 hypothetical protein [Streptomyces sp. SID2563]
MSIGLEKALGGGDDEVFAGGEAEEEGWLYVARAEMVLARPDHRQLTAAARCSDAIRRYVAYSAGTVLARLRVQYRCRCWDVNY